MAISTWKYMEGAFRRFLGVQVLCNSSSQTLSNIASMFAAGDDGQAGRQLRPRQQQQEPPPAQPHAGHLRLAGLRCEQTGH